MRNEQQLFHLTSNSCTPLTAPPHSVNNASRVLRHRAKASGFSKLYKIRFIQCLFTQPVNDVVKAYEMYSMAQHSYSKRLSQEVE
jgi:hypothetical protein